MTKLLDQAEIYATDSYKYSLLLGIENYRLLRTNPGPNSSCMSKKERLQLAIENLKSMYEREFITIPPIERKIEINNKDNKINSKLISLSL